MASKSEKDQIRVWLSRIKAAQARRDRLNKKIWERCESALEASFKDDKSEIHIMLLLSAFLTMRASLFFQNPKYRVVPAAGRNTMNADYLEAALDYFINDNNGLTTFKRQMKQVVSDGITSIGISREVHELDSVTNPNAGRQVITNGEPERDEQGNPIVEPDRIPVAEHFRTLRVSPKLHLVDSMAKQDLIEGTWVGEEIWRSLIDVKDDPRFSHTKNLKPMLTVKTEGESEMAGTQSVRQQLEGPPLDERSNLAHLYYLEDIKEHRIIVIAEGHDKFLMNEPMPPGIETTSYSYLQFVETNGDNFYGIPPLWPLIEPQLAYNEASEHLKEIRFFDIVKILVQKNAFTREDKKKLSSRTNMQIVEPKVAGNLNNMVHIPSPPQPRPMDTFFLDKSKIEMTQLSGLTQERLLGTSGAPTLGQAQMVAQQADIKESERQDILTDYLDMVGMKKAQMIQSSFLLPISTSQINPDGKLEPLTIQDRNLIAGAMNVKMNIGSTAKKNETMERAQMNDAFTRLYPDPSPITLHYDSKVFADKLARVNKMEEIVTESDVTQMGVGALPPTPALSPTGNKQPAPSTFPPRNERDVLAGLLQRGQANLPLDVTGTGG